MGQRRPWSATGFQAPDRYRSCSPRSSTPSPAPPGAHSPPSAVGHHRRPDKPRRRPHPCPGAVPADVAIRVPVGPLSP